MVETNYSNSNMCPLYPSFTNIKIILNLHVHVASLSADEKITNIQNDLHDYVNSSYT